ncbi:hypothetical protein D3C72_856910 [compost metagenome]
MQAGEQGNGRVVWIAGAAVVEFQLVNRQRGAQAIVEPIALHADFLLLGQFGAQVVGVTGRARRDADQTAADRRERLRPGRVEGMILQWRPDQSYTWAGAVAVTILRNIPQLVGRLDVERVVTQTAEQLPLIVQLQLILDVHRAAFDFGVRTARYLHAPGVAQVAVGVVQVQRRHR